MFMQKNKHQLKLDMSENCFIIYKCYRISKFSCYFKFSIASDQEPITCSEWFHQVPYLADGCVYESRKDLAAYIQRTNNYSYHSMQIFLPFHWPRAHHVTWKNNCLQIMVCSCAMSSICVWLQKICRSCVNETALFPFLQSLLLENGKMSGIH